MQHHLTERSTQYCSGCPLLDAPGVIQHVTTEAHGDNIDVMFVGDGPGKAENEAGRPVVGPEGMILRRTVRQINEGVQDGVAYGNMVRCRPTQRDNVTQDRKPAPREIACCRNNVLRDIAAIRPKYVVFCGALAAHGIAYHPGGDAVNTQTKITALRGQDYEVRLPDGTIIPATITFRFSHVAHQPSQGGVFREDIARAFRRAKGQLRDYSKRGAPVTILTDIDQIYAHLRQITTKSSPNNIVAFDYETDSLQRLHNKLLCIGFATRPDRAFVIPYQHRESPWTAPEFRKLRAMFHHFFSVRQPAYRSLVAHNLMFEAIVTRTHFGAPLRMRTEDTMQRAHALNEDRKGAMDHPYGLKRLVEEQLGFYHYRDPDIAPIVRLRDQGRLAEASLKDLAEYNGMDCYADYRLFYFQEQWAAAEGYQDELRRLGLFLHGPITRVLSEMERNGLRADMEMIRELAAANSPIVQRQDEILRQLHVMPRVVEANRLLLDDKEVGSSGLWGQKRKALWMFDAGKPDHKRMLFFDTMGLKEVNKSKKTKTPSVNQAFFKKYEDVPEVSLVHEWDALRKLRSTYITSIKRFLDRDPDMQDGRVRTHFHPTGTITGRPSTSDPGMQNIPKKNKKNKAAKAIKRMYVADAGHVIVCADYSQAEVRWLAEVTGDPDLIRAFCRAYEARENFKRDPSPENLTILAREGDFHKWTASMINNVDLDMVTKPMRQAAKAIMFGLVYGMTVFGLAARLNVSREEAQDFIDEFFKRFPKAQEWLDAQEVRGFEDGYVLSPTGRRKLAVSGMLSGSINPEAMQYLKRNVREFITHELRVFRNAPIQGVASDTTMLAAAAIHDHVLDNKLPWRMVNTVYDSVMIEVPFPDTVQCCEVVQRIMEDPAIFEPFDLKPRVPFASDLSVGVNWGDQWDVADHEKNWAVTCLDCSEERGKRPENRLCEVCGSTNLSLSMVTGPLTELVQQLDSKYNLSAYWG